MVVSVQYQRIFHANKTRPAFYGGPCALRAFYGQSLCGFYSRVYDPRRGSGFSGLRGGKPPATESRQLLFCNASPQRKRNKIALLAGVFAPDVKQPVYHLARERRERGQRGRGRKGVAREDSSIDPRVCVCVCEATAGHRPSRSPPPPPRHSP